MALTSIFNRLDSYPEKDSDFPHPIDLWMSNIVDVVNYDLSLLESCFVKGTVTFNPLNGGVAVVTTNKINTGDFIVLNATNYVSPGFIKTSIINGVSFTLTSTSATDGSSYTYMIIKNLGG